MRGNSRSREREKKRSYMKVSYISASFANTDFPGGSNGKASVYNAGDPGSIPGLGRSPGGGNGNPLQYFGHLMRRVDSLEKTLMLGGIGGRRRRG